VTTKTTVHLKLPDVRSLWSLPTPAAITIVLFCLLAIAGIVGQIRSAPSVVAVPTPGLIILIATAPAIVPPTAIPAAVVYAQAPAPEAPAVRYVVAFAAPGGDVLGPIPAPALAALIARWGDAWVATLHDGNTVWVRVSELGGSIANVQPAPPPPPIVREEIPIAPIVAPNVPPPPAPVAEQPPAPTFAPPPTPLPIVQAAQPNNFDTDVERNWAQSQWQSEHCVAGVCR